jgi:hypothetical protein
LINEKGGQTKMAMYQNFTRREVTVFLSNAVPIKFMPGEHKQLAQEGLEKIYASYLRRVDLIKEGKDKENKKPEKGLISEVKQPDKNKELLKEPVAESTKKGKVITEEPKVSEGYSPWIGEVTVASAGRQGKE